MFDHIRPYTEFYFYFLLLVYGFSYKQVHLCHSCAHKTFLKTLGLNLIFIIGVPSAIWLKVKSMMNRNPQFEGLAKANALAKAGRPMDAEPYFQQVLAQNPRHPAVLMNRAIGQINGGDKNGAVACLQESLRACNHYLPALRMLN